MDRRTFVMSCVALAVAPRVARALDPAEPSFRSARPIWPRGRATEMNLFVGFRTKVRRAPSRRVVLRLAASSLYRASVNGRFVGHGPARGPHGFYRVDEWDLTPMLTPGDNILAVEVAGYNVNSFYLLDQPAFLQAEVLAGETVVASTGGAGEAFVASVLDYRVQKVQRYSFQRTFVEAYRLDDGFSHWQSEWTAPFATAEVEVQPAKALLPRRVAQPDFAVVRPARHVSDGRIERREAVEKLWKDRSLVNVGPAFKAYPEPELALVLSTELQHLDSSQTASLDRPWSTDDAVPLSAGRFRILDLGRNLTGFPGLVVTCSAPTELRIVFDEILSAGDVDFKRLTAVNAISYSLRPGTFRLEAIEPYTLRYLKLICLEGACRVSDVTLREYGHPPVAGARFAASDERLNRLFDAGVATFRQNTLDVFMDCPSRERAGWLCDSFFTARSAFALTGRTLVEDAFLENYQRAERFAFLPDGMLPMCYPADHNDGVFIPNWALWLVVQLEEYAARGGDRAILDGLKARVLRLFEFFRQYENADGLLEKLPSWVFVEWSAANSFVQDVNYPSNMLYAGALSAASRLFALPELAAKAARIRDTVRRQSFDGEFFVDNAVRKDGRLEVTRNRSEVCQYFAFFFDVADVTTHAALWERLRDKFGPDRQTSGAFPDVHAANSFVGNMLRLELLSRDGRHRQVLDESVGYLMYMAERTGTLWENVQATASLNHGFASHIVRTLQRDALGVQAIDPVRRTVLLRFGDAALQWCEGTVPTPGGPLTVRWERTGDGVSYRVAVPVGYTVSVENRTGGPLRRAVVS
jgi:alpha-L-rhamnosidase